MPRPNNGARLRPNAKGIYEIRWSEGGRSCRVSTRTSDLSKAQKTFAGFLLGHEAEKAAERHEATALTVMEALGDPDDDLDEGEDYWHEHVLRNVIGIQTARFAVRKLIEHFGMLPVKDLTPQRQTAYIDARRAGKIGRPSQDGTIKREMVVLRAAVNHAVKAKRLTHDDAPFIAMPNESPPRDRWLTADEIDKLLEAALQGRSPDKPYPRIYRFIVLALATASRKTAILQLTKSQVDLERRLIHFNPKGRRQTNKRRPPVPISDELLPIITKMVKDAKGDLLLDKTGDVYESFDAAVKRAGLVDVTPHTLRHTWATLAAQNGVSLLDIAAVLGDSYATVERTYLHHCPEHLRKAVNFSRRAA